MYSNLTLEFYASICKKRKKNEREKNKKRRTIQPFCYFFRVSVALNPVMSLVFLVETVGCCLVSEFVLILYVIVWIVKGHHGTRNMEVNGL